MCDHSINNSLLAPRPVLPPCSTRLEYQYWGPNIAWLSLRFYTSLCNNQCCRCPKYSLLLSLVRVSGAKCSLLTRMTKATNMLWAPPRADKRKRICSYTSGWSFDGSQLSKTPLVPCLSQTAGFGGPGGPGFWGPGWGPGFGWPFFWAGPELGPWGLPVSFETETLR